jgi:hypothetical protein
MQKITRRIHPSEEFPRLNWNLLMQYCINAGRVAKSGRDRVINYSLIIREYANEKSLLVLTYSARFFDILFST